MKISNEVLDYLGRAEGLDVHKNEGEEDITSPYGIYKYKHPKAEIFKYIDEVAADAGIANETSNYTQSDMYVINTTIERNETIAQKIRKLASEFYSKYYANIYLDLVPKEAQLAFLSCYTTSEYGGQKSVQAALNDMLSLGEIIGNKLSEDGAFGGITKSALLKIKVKADYKGKYFGYWFEEKILRHMVMYYDKLAIENPEEYKRFYKGWRNRMEALADSK